MEGKKIRMSPALDKKEKKAPKVKKPNLSTNTNTGSPEFQITMMTERLTKLNEHFRTHVKDHHSKRGLLQIVGKRKRLLRYLENTNPAAYKKLVSDLGIRSSI
jgi:small subunit ribosomal protein S15